MEKTLLQHENFYVLDSFRTGGTNITPVIPVTEEGVQFVLDNLVGIAGLYAGSLSSSLGRVGSKFKTLSNHIYNKEKLLLQEERGDSYVVDLMNFKFSKEDTSLVEGKYMRDLSAVFFDNTVAFKDLPIGEFFTFATGSGKDHVFLKTGDEDASVGRRESKDLFTDSFIYQKENTSIIRLENERLKDFASFVVRKATFNHPVKGPDWRVDSYFVENAAETKIATEKLALEAEGVTRDIAEPYAHLSHPIEVPRDETTGAEVIRFTNPVRWAIHRLD